MILAIAAARPIDEDCNENHDENDDVDHDETPVIIDDRTPAGTWVTCTSKDHKNTGILNTEKVSCIIVLLF